MSVSASGAFAGLICMEQRRGVQVARRAPAPSGAPSGPQAAEREKARQAAIAWRALGETTKAEWHALAASQGIPVFARYLREWMAQQSTPEQPPFIPYI